MAQDHGYQDNPSTRWSKAGMPSDELDTESSREPSTAAILIALGANAWVTSVGWTLLPADVRLQDGALAAVGLVWLLLGAILHVRKHSSRSQIAARWVLLCVYPASLAAALCLGSEATRERAHSPVSMLFSALSLLAYGVAAVLASREPLALLTSVSHVRQRERKSSALGLRRLRVLVIALLLAGALCIAVIAPLVPAYGEVESAWGGASEAGAVLAAVVGGALGVTVLAIHLGALLHGRPLASRGSARERRSRIATLLFLALLGLVVYFSVVH
jgi:hypothetical protein